MDTVDAVQYTVLNRVVKMGLRKEKKTAGMHLFTLITQYCQVIHYV